MGEGAIDMTRLLFFLVSHVSTPGTSIKKLEHALPYSRPRVLSKSRDLHTGLSTISMGNLVFLFFSPLARKGLEIGGGSRPPF